MAIAAGYSYSLSPSRASVPRSTFGIAAKENRFRYLAPALSVPLR